MTTSAPPMVLLVDSNASRCEQTAFALSTRSEFQVHTANNLPDARALLRHPKLVAIACDEGGVRGEDGPALLREVRGMLNLDHVAFILMTEAGSSGARIAAWTLDADAVIGHPAHAAELQACVQACQRRRAVEATLATEFTRRGRDADQTVELLRIALEAIAPGARLRGEETLALAATLARELNVPPELIDDLRRAARLIEIGRLVVKPSNCELPSGSPTGALLVASAALIEPIPSLIGAAELINGMGANWDGSGVLTQLEHGSIPMRSRVLRAVTDYLALRHQQRDPEDNGAAACDLLALHSGTCYDPAVLSELALIVTSWYDQTHDLAIEPLHVEQLTEGRVLVNDLYTASGVKLLSAGALLTPANLRLIAERHALDPIVHAIATRRGEG
jgi:response regulator RpfG family c-di-GMP phosphodiesterase